jgi:hypothetical protein
VKALLSSPAIGIGYWLLVMVIDTKVVKQMVKIGGERCDVA